MSFLNAEWRKLILVNYEIDPEVLKPYIPSGTELDLWKGKCYISLVGFMFLNTKMLGLKIPFHINFEEVNLRYYVKRIEGEKIKRGVAFVKEIVPKRAISIVANVVYKENYETLKMGHIWKIEPENLFVEYRWRKKGKWYKISLNAYPTAENFPVRSETEFITEHYWGYAKHGNKTNEYEVTHPRWQVYSVKDFLIEVDFELLYGKDFAFLNGLEPSSVMLAEGSEITVESKRSLKL